MTKQILNLIPALLILILIKSTTAQVNDTIKWIPVDSLLLEEVFHDDSLLFDDEMPDENLNDIFLEYFEDLATSADSLIPEIFPMNVPDSVYIARLLEIEQVIDLSYNNVVRNFIVMYTERKRNLVKRMLGLSEYYFPIFEEALDRHDMPIELKYLPVIESALNPNARSRVGANGLWQFMYGTGKEMKLEINSFIDERRDPVKSTDAAIRYLKMLYDRYNDWHLAIAAYNCGPGNVDKAIRRAGGKTNYWQIYYMLPRETRGYVPAFIAASYVMNYYLEHNLMPEPPEIPVLADTVMVSNYLHFEQISSMLNMEKEQLQALNPMYRREVIPARPEKPYPLILPSDKVMHFIDRDTMIFAWNRDRYFPDNTLVNPSNSAHVAPSDVKGKAKVTYVVKSGDNVGFIASWFKVRTSDLRYWNNINRNLIRVGQKLVIYVPENQKSNYEKINQMSFTEKQAMKGKAPAPAQTKEITTTDADFVYHTVRRGDTIWDIAGKYDNVTSDEILKLNNLRSGRNLYIGQKLKIKKKS